MSKSIISEGKTTTEAVEKGLKELNVSKDKVEIKVLENENKKSFFSILTPRVVKVELTLKENVKKEENNKKEIKEEKTKKEYENNIENINESKNKVEKFLKEWLAKVDENLEFKISIEEYIIKVDIKGKSAGLLIGYHGETLNSMQTILSTIANRNNLNNKIKLIVDIENYREKRNKILEDLAEKVSKTVLKNGKNITLEPMPAYERKIIHSKLQDNSKVETYSIGEGENRRIVIAKKVNK